MPSLGELLQEIGVSIRAVANRFEVFAELVDDEQQRGIFGQATGHFEQGRRRGADSTWVIGCGVGECGLERFSRSEGAPRGDGSIGPDDGGMKRLQDGVVQRLAAGGDYGAVEPPILSSPGLMGASEEIGYGRRCRLNEFGRNRSRGTALAECGVDEQRER